MDRIMVVDLSYLYETAYSIPNIVVEDVVTFVTDVRN